MVVTPTLHEKESKEVSIIDHHLFMEEYGKHSMEKEVFSHLSV